MAEGEIRSRYRGEMPLARMAPIPRPPALDSYHGLWVATIGDEIVAAAETSHQLALQLHNMDHRSAARCRDRVRTP